MCKFRVKIKKTHLDLLLLFIECVGVFVATFKNLGDPPN